MAVGLWLGDALGLGLGLDVSVGDAVWLGDALGLGADGVG